VLYYGAARGFEILGADAQAAAPELIGIYDHKISEGSQYAASRALVALGPSGQIAIPSFLGYAVGSDLEARKTAIGALLRVHAEPSLVLPVLVKSLGETNDWLRWLAATSLAELGTKGRETAPALVPLLNDPDRDVRSAATNALRRVDLEVAVRAGVK